MNKILTAERLREVLDYNAATGAFTWKVRAARRIRIGDVAGSPNKDGYVVIRIDGKLYMAHRLAWLFIYGVWPEYELDHIDLNKANNAIENLRKATRSQNQHNRGMYANNKTRFKGVSWYKQRGKYRAQIGVNGRGKYLGLFATIAAASAAYSAAAREFHGEFARLA